MREKFEFGDIIVTDTQFELDAVIDKFPAKFIFPRGVYEAYNTPPLGINEWVTENISQIQSACRWFVLDGPGQPGGENQMAVKDFETTMGLFKKK